MLQAQATPRPASAPVQPQRIVSLLPAATEILCFLGIADRLVGISHQCRPTPELAGIPRVTFSAIDPAATSEQIDVQVRERTQRGEPLYGIDEAALSALKPDLIVTQAQCDVCAVRYDDVLAAARRIAPDNTIKVLALKPATYKDIVEDILRVGEAAGESSAALQRVKEAGKRLSSVRRSVQTIPVSHRPRVAVIEWIEPLMIAANWTPDLVEMAGGEYGLAAAGKHSQYVAWDDVRQNDPQVLLVAPCGFDVARTLAESARLAELPGWGDVSAVRDGRVWALDGDAHLNCPSPGLFDTVELLAYLLHPGRMPAPDVKQRTWQRIVGP